MTPEERIRTAILQALSTMGVADAQVQLERPRDPSHGDLASNVALTLAKQLRKAPRQIAEELKSRIDPAQAGITDVEVAGPGFLNFRLAGGTLAQRLADVLTLDEAYGRSATGAGEKIMVEWVSANPTGPLHMGHGRQAALGDAICHLLEWTGWSVHREFYYNDAGNQMEMLGASVWARYQQVLGEPAEVPENGYQGEYIIDVAKRFITDVGDRYRNDGSQEALDAMRIFAVRVLMAEIQRDLADFRVSFDCLYRESSLYEDGRVDRTVEALRATGYTYEHEGALWLRTTAFGDDKDRVMLRGNGLPTYFLPDVAYHMSKWERGFHRVINVQGSDHHGTVTRVRAGVRALGLPEGYPDYVLHQMVRFERGGVEVKASKRAGSYTTLRELYEEVGVDVTRYFFQMRRPEAHLLFDLDLALEQSDRNPVYKIQYAHARMHSIFAKAGIDPATVRADGVNLGLLEHPSERELVKHLLEFPETVERAAAGRAPHLMCDYLEEAAGQVNSWYHAGNPSRDPGLAVLAPDPGLRAARLVLARSVLIVLRNGLRILGITTPQRMERATEVQATV